MTKWNNRIFISRAGADAEASTWAADVLEASGFTCVYQERDFKIGESFVRNMREAFETCDTMLAIMSPDYWASAYCLDEWDAAYSFDRGKKGKLIPIMQRPSEPPKLQAHLAYLDLTRHSEAERDKILREAVHAALTQNTPLPDRIELTKLPLSNSAFVTKNFTGRDDELAHLNKALWSETGAAALTSAKMPTAISGLGGVGKSAIAREYARRHGHRYAGTWLVRSETREEMVQDIEALAVRLNPSLENKDDNYNQAFIEAQRLSNDDGRPFLFVFDNVEMEEDVPEEARAKHFHTIATSRWEAWTDAEQISIGTLPGEAAADLMLSITGRHATDAGFSDLIDALDGLALAIVQAGAYLRENTYESFADYHNALQARLGEKATGRKADDLVSATFAPSIEKAEAAAPGARELLISTAFYAPDDVPLAILSEEPESAEIKKAASALLRYSLVTEGEMFNEVGRSISLHRILQQVLRAQLEEEAKEGLLKISAMRLQYALPSENPYNNPPIWPFVAPLVPHIVALDKLDKLGTGADALSSSLDKAASFYESRANYDLAEPLYQRALEIEEANQDPEHPTVAIRLSNLGSLLMATKRFEEAEPLIRRAVEIDEANFGPDDPNVVDHLSNLSSLFYYMKRLDEAESLMRKVLQLIEAHYGPDHPKLAVRLNNLAVLLKDTNRQDEAEAFYTRALTIDEASLGPDHTIVALRLKNLAHLLAETGRAGDALPLARRAHAIFAASLPEGHPDRSASELDLPWFKQMAAAEQNPEE